MDAGPNPKPNINPISLPSFNQNPKPLSLILKPRPSNIEQDSVILERFLQSSRIIRKRLRETFATNQQLYWDSPGGSTLHCSADSVSLFFVLSLLAINLLQLRPVDASVLVYCTRLGQ